MCRAEVPDQVTLTEHPGEAVHAHRIVAARVAAGLDDQAADQAACSFLPTTADAGKHSEPERNGMSSDFIRFHLSLDEKGSEIGMNRNPNHSDSVS